jgi:cobalt-zinc-cadmium efflux system membrane fusion protein
MKPIVVAALTGLIAAVCITGTAVAEGFEMSDDQLARLGVELERPAEVESMILATGPAQIALPPAGQNVTSAPVDGLLTRMLVAVGDEVAAGQIIAELESPELLDWQRDYLDARIEADLAAMQLERDRALHAEGVIADRRLEETEARNRAAAARLDQTQQHLRIAGFTAAEIRALAADGRLTSRLALRAPLAGVVTARFAEPGARVYAMDPVAGIASLDEVWAEMHLAAEKADGITVGMTMQLLSGLDSVAATITVVGRVLDPATQTVLIRAAIDDDIAGLHVGRFVQAEVHAGMSDGPGYAVPATALVRNGEEAFVFVRVADGFEVVPVVPVHEDEHRALIASGVDGTMQIAVTGTSTLKALWLSSLEGDG